MEYLCTQVDRRKTIWVHVYLYTCLPVYLTKDPRNSHDFINDS
jgi:hypothetical protein